MSNNQMPSNAKRPIKTAKEPTEEQKQALGRLGGLLGGNRKGPYAPITKSMETIDIPLRILDVYVDDSIQECIVIPVSELIFKEWRHMTGSSLKPQPMEPQPQNEGKDDDGPIYDKL